MKRYTRVKLWNGSVASPVFCNLYALVLRHQYLLFIPYSLFFSSVPAARVQGARERLAIGVYHKKKQPPCLQASGYLINNMGPTVHRSAPFCAHYSRI